MTNEVVIHVRVDEDIDKSFGAIKEKTTKFGTDIGEEVKKVGPKVGSGLGDGMLSGLTTTLPSFGQFGAVIGGIMAPTLGATVAAGVAGAAGGAGILGGLSIAAKDPLVQATGAELKATIGNDLKSAASGWVPLAISSMGKLKDGFRKILPDIRSIFEDSKNFVGPLLDGIIDGGARIVSSIKNVVSGAQPVFDAFGRAFAEIGDAVGDVFDGLADNGTEGASAVDDLSTAISGWIRVMGEAVNGLTEMKGGLDSFDEWIDDQRESLEDNVDALDLTADGYNKNSEAARLYREGLIGVAGSANDYNAYLKKQKEASEGVTSATKDQTGALQELSDKMKEQSDPLFALISAQRKVNKAQNDYNEALKKHGPKSAEAKEALTALGEAAFDLTGRAGDAAGKFDGTLTPAMRTALRNAKLTKSQISALEKQLKKAAAAANAWEGTFTQTYVTKTISYGATASHNGNVAAAKDRNEFAHGGITGAATGGIRSRMTLVGEHGPELLSLPPGSRVNSNPDTMRMLGGQGGGSSHIEFSFRPGAEHPLIQAIVKALRYEISHSGSGNVQQFLGSRYA